MKGTRAERRQRRYLQVVGQPWRDIADWPSVDADTVRKDAVRERLRRLTKAAGMFLKAQPLSEVLAVAQVSEDQFFHLMDRALAPMEGTDQIRGTRAFVLGKVQSKRKRLQPFVAGKKFGGYGGLFEQLLREYTEIAPALIAFLNGEERPNKVTPRILHTKFLQVCRQKGVPAQDYPFNTVTQGFHPLQDWYKKVYQPANLIAHVRKQHGSAAAVAAAYERGDGTSQTPPIPYTVWVIDEFKVDLDTVIELPMARWDVEYVALSMFQVLRCRSIGNVQCNIAWHMCLRAQASGDDVIRLFRNAVMGQPAVDVVEESMTYEPGAGFPQNLFPQVRFAVPILVYLDNALSHLFNPLQTLLQRLYGGHVILGVPGRPKGRPAIESAIGHLLNNLIHQLPSTTGTGPNDPLREQAQVPVGNRVPIGLLEQALDVYMANENVTATAGAGYLGAFTRLARMAAAGQIKCNFLPETKRRAHHFCEPKPVTIHCDLDKGRLPYVYYRHRRYSSEWLKTQPALRNKELRALADYDDLRTIVLIDDTGAVFTTVTCEGAWSRVPHDQRMLDIYSKRRSDAQFKTRPGDAPLFAVLNHLASRAKAESQAALEYAYIMRYLKRHLPPEALVAHAEDGEESFDFIDVASRVLPDPNGLPAPQPARQAAQKAPLKQPAAAPSRTSPRDESIRVPAPAGRFQIPRRLG